MITQESGKGLDYVPVSLFRTTDAIFIYKIISNKIDCKKLFEMFPHNEYRKTRVSASFNLPL